MTVNTETAAIESYIAAAPPATQEVLRRIRQIARDAAPEARELISYCMPALRGRGILIYYAAFKNHIGLFPPIKADATLDQALAPYRGPNGNLRLPLTEPIPYEIIRDVVLLRVAQDKAKAAR